MSTYYVAKNGTDNAPGTSTQPRLTIAAGIGLLAPGDTLVVRDGTYQEPIINMPGGRSASEPTIIRAEHQYKAVITPTDAHQLPSYTIIGINAHYVTIDGFYVGNTNFTSYGITTGQGVNYTTIENCEVASIPGNGSSSNALGIVMGHETAFNVIRNNKIHDMGYNETEPGQAFYSYAFYFYSNDTLIEGNECYNCSGYCFHFYNNSTLGDGDRLGNRNIIRNNIFRDSGEPVLFATAGNDNQFYNNLVYHNGYCGNRGGHAGINIGSYSGLPTDNNWIFNNVVYGNKGVAIFADYRCTNTQIVNNICIGNEGGDYVRTESGSTSVNSHNAEGGDAAQYFVDASHGDFHLASGSPAIGAGADLSGQIAAIDYAGQPRTAPWDQGAYRAGAPVTPPDKPPERPDRPPITPPDRPDRPPVTPPTATTPRCWWPIEEGRGTRLTDLTGTGNPGRLEPGTGGVLPTWVPGQFGRYALHFAGKKDHVMLAGQATLGPFTVGLTLCADTAIRGGLTSIPLLMLWDQPGNEIGFNWDNTDPVFRQAWALGIDGNYLALQYTSALAAGTPYRLVLTYDGTSLHAYCNGVLEASVATALPAGLWSGLLLSATGALGDWQGTIEEVRLENAGYTRIEVKADYMRTVPQPMPRT